jgi:hypothetical protein
MILKITHIFALFLVCTATCVHAQTWEKVGNGVSGNVRLLFSDTVSSSLIVGGKFQYAYTVNDTFEVNTIGSWDGNSWNAFPPGDTLCTHTCPWAPTSATRIGDSLLIGGIFPNFGGSTNTRYVACWYNNTWLPFGDANAPLGLERIGDTIYAVGWMDSIGGIYVNGLGKYPAHSSAGWQTFSNTPFSIGTACVEMYNSQLIVGGNFNYYGISDLARWNGMAFDDFGHPVVGGLASVSDLQTYGDYLFAGGYFQQAAGSAGDWLVYYDGTTWRGLPMPIQYVGTVFRFKVHNGVLYIAGAVQVGSSVYGLASYDGQNFCTYGGANNFPIDIEFHNGYLYANTASLVFAGDTMNWLARLPLPLIPDTCVSMVLGVDEAIHASEMMLYPNPASGEVTIECIATAPSAGTLHLFDLSGRLVYATTVQAQAGVNRFTIPTGALGAGVYTVTVTLNDAIYTGRLVIN